MITVGRGGHYANAHGDTAHEWPETPMEVTNAQTISEDDLMESGAPRFLRRMAGYTASKGPMEVRFTEEAWSTGERDDRRRARDTDELDDHIPTTMTTVAHLWGDNSGYRDSKQWQPKYPRLNSKGNKGKGKGEGQGQQTEAQRSDTTIRRLQHRFDRVELHR